MGRVCDWLGCSARTTKGTLCFQHRPRTPLKTKRRYIKPESDKAREQRVRVREEWFKVNPPDFHGVAWYCYLNKLSPDCWVVMNEVQIMKHGLEHVTPKVKSRALKFEVSNLRAACPPCNKLKGSRTIEQCIRKYGWWTPRDV